jgi:hypothetical protein
MQSDDAQKIYPNNLVPQALSPGTWYRLEFLVEFNTPGVKNGVLAWWTSTWNGTSWSTPVQNALHTNVLLANTGASGRWANWEYNMYYGGQGAPPLAADQFIIINRAYLSTRP